jgi:hypothetical protein
MRPHQLIADMHFDLDLALKFATPVGVMGGFMSLIYTINNSADRLTSKYS